MNGKNDVKELVEILDKLVLRVNELEKRLEKLEKGSIGTGVYLNGVPEYAKEYITKDREGEK